MSSQMGRNDSWPAIPLCLDREMSRICAGGGVVRKFSSGKGEVVRAEDVCPGFHRGCGVFRGRGELA